MTEPCRSCDRRAEDFGGCRCQAFLLAGDPAATDPACSLAPTHNLVESAVAAANASPVVAQPKSSASLVQLQRQTEKFWNYRTNPK